MNKKRLLKLADHLEKGTLGHKKFKFDTYNEFRESEDVAPKCGYAGCAIGECPVIFKKDWNFSLGGVPKLNSKKYLDGDDAAMKYFDIKYDECQHLFMPEMQNEDRYGGRYLERNATRNQVAKNIRAFVKKMEVK